MLKLHETDLQTGTLTLKDIEKAAIDQSGRDHVEAAAWRITLKDGRVLTAEHTSRSTKHVTSDDLVAAWNGIISGNKIQISDIENVQWFHTHPSKAFSTIPLSKGDEITFRTFRSELNKRGGQQIPITIYSIFRADNTLGLSSVSF